jgi:glycogen debranching enzyme
VGTGNDDANIAGQHDAQITSARADDRTRVLKHGDSFAVFDRHGDIAAHGSSEQGIFHEGTRYLSWCELLINGARPLLLSSTVKNRNTLLAVDLTNPSLPHGSERVIEHSKVHIFRAKVLWEAACHEHLRLTSYSDDLVHLELSLLLAADYADIFEVRGARRARRGRLLPAAFQERRLVLSYEGLDGLVRTTELRFSQQPEFRDGGVVCFRLSVEPGGDHELYIFSQFYTGEPPQAGDSILSGLYGSTLRESAETLERSQLGDCTIVTSNEQFNGWLSRSQADVHMLCTRTEHGYFPYAGIPWFSTPFGRDGIITALEYLWVNPEIAQGVLRYLAAFQAQVAHPEQEAEPGKILHEMRKGEMAALGEIPFRCYYGTVDATPLMIELAGAYYERTGDRELIQALWPALEAALAWIDAYGDLDGDGFVEYQSRNPRGLVHQGWKDSDDAVFHADGQPADGAIALCEVQGYVYAAKRRAAMLARVFGDPAQAEQLAREAAALKVRFNQAYWCDELSTYAIALDGAKQPCRVRTSNAGHALWSGIAEASYAERLGGTLLARHAFSGWGVRTVSDIETRYNPMSYHNGSVWPHDNALIAMGLARSNQKDRALRIMTSLFDASVFMDLHRLPEVFCGFVRRPDEGPTIYSSACIPQAWAAAAVFYLLQACLGITFDGAARELRFDHPLLPVYLNHIEIRNLSIGDARVDLELRRHARDVSVNVLRKEGDLKVSIVV